VGIDYLFLLPLAGYYVEEDLGLSFMAGWRLSAAGRVPKIISRLSSVNV
jgi:hypothetical protein